MKALFILLLSIACASAQSFVPGADAALGASILAPNPAAPPPGIAILNTNFVALANGAGSTPWLTNTITVSAGSRIVLGWASENNSSVVPDGYIVSSPALTWAKAADYQSLTNGDCEIWTSSSTSAATYYITNTFNVSSTDLQFPARSQMVWELSNVEGTMAGASKTNCDAGNWSAPLSTLTTTRANSIIIGVISDWAAKAPPVTLRASAHLDAQHPMTPNNYRADFFSLQTTTATSYGMGESAPTGQNPGICLLEIRTP